MATAMMPPRVGGETIKLEYGRPEVLALKYTTGKNGPDSQFPPFLPRVLFTMEDGRRLFLDSEDASDFEMKLRELCVRPGEPIRVTKVRHPRGGGHSLRVEALTNDADMTAVLERSIERVHEQRAQLQSSTPSVSSSSSERMAAALKASIDAWVEGMAYARRAGLELTPTAEDIRAMAATAYISESRSGR